MRCCIDIECNALKNPTRIWCVVLKDIDTGEYHVFRNLTEDQEEKRRFLETCDNVELFIGHNIIDYDLPIIKLLLGYNVNISRVLDTLVLSKLVDYPRETGHSIESYGIEFNLPKGEFHDWSKLTEEMVTYCTRDVDICHRIYNRYSSVIRSDDWRPSIRLEHEFACVCHSLSVCGFGFDTTRASNLLERVTREIEKLDEDIKNFPPRLVFTREVSPKGTKWGTINQSSIPRELRNNIEAYSIEAPFSYCKWETFNPDSLKQVINLLWRAGWIPEDKTKGHIEAIREKDIDKLEKFKYYGYKVNETNLATLPPHAPPAAKTLARRILYESRRRTLTEWLSLVTPSSSRIHGKFVGLGAWTHRMSHQSPNMANIPNSTDTQGNTKFLGAEMRSLFIAPSNRLLVGVDAAAIQLRIFAHYIDDPEFTKSLVEGKKEYKSDPHSLNQRVLGKVCRSRASAKRFIFALLLGAGIGKLSEILDASRSETQDALERLLKRYEGFARLKSTIIPKDATRGYFTGLDGRRVRIPGTKSQREHLCMSGYLQNGEAVVMKMATLIWKEELDRLLFPDQWSLVNLVHDEWQTECLDNIEIAIKIAETQSNSLKTVGERLKLKCPLEGSYKNDDGEYTIGRNWKITH